MYVVAVVGLLVAVVNVMWPLGIKGECEYVCFAVCENKFVNAHTPDLSNGWFI